MNLLDPLDLSRIDLSAAARLLNEPCLMEAGFFNALVGRAVNQAYDGTLTLGADTQPRPRADGYYTPIEHSEAHGIAIMKIRGMITPYDVGTEKTNPFGIAQDAIALRENPAIHTVILDIDSGGGTGTGINYAATQLENLAATKRLISWNSSMAASAAYWLAAPAPEIYGAPDSETGSIGVYITLPDFSKLMEEKLGIKMHVLRDGPLKGLGIFGKKLTEAEKDHLMEKVMDLSDIFKSYIRGKRAGIEEKTMSGQTFTAKRSIEANLIDGICTDLPDLVSSLI